MSDVIHRTADEGEEGKACWPDRPSDLYEDDVDKLIARHSPGYALEQPFYMRSDVFDLDLERVVYPQWLFVDHESRIPKKGDWFLFRVGREEIIVSRGAKDQVHAFYNVCRHRGSRICLENQGHNQVLACPYHAWTYELDGRLRFARLMPEGFDRSDWGLKTVNVRIWHGFIYIHLGHEEPDDFHKLVSPLEPFIKLQGIENARIVHRGQYPVKGNWKLVVENYFECYHCQPSHPSYCKVHSQEYVLARGGGPGSAPEEALAAFETHFQAFKQKASSLGYPAGDFLDERGAQHLRLADRVPLRDDFKSETADGLPAAPLMGDFEKWDSGYAGVSLNPFHHLVMPQDFVVSFRFTPRDALNTDVELVWLVDGNAREEDVDVDRLTWLWHNTILEDKQIVEDNQTGVNSAAYIPGPYSKIEQLADQFVLWYLSRLGQC